MPLKSQLGFDLHLEELPFYSTFNLDNILVTIL